MREIIIYITIFFINCDIIMRENGDKNELISQAIASPHSDTISLTSSEVVIFL